MPRSLRKRNLIVFTSTFSPSIPPSTLPCHLLRFNLDFILCKQVNYKKIKGFDLDVSKKVLIGLYFKEYTES